MMKGYMMKVPGIFGLQKRFVGLGQHIVQGFGVRQA